MDIAETETWYRKAFGKELLTVVDLYRMGRLQYSQGNYQAAVACLERYVACTPQIEIAAIHLLGHAHRSAFYEATGDRKPPTGPQESMPNGLKLTDQRLLESLRKALECYVAAVRQGFDDDWQMVVETKMELDQFDEDGE